MISIQSAMLVTLGFLAASLLALLIAPAFWARAVRLTTGRIKDTMPLTELEIRADKDRLRAEYAIKVHKLESQMEQVRLAAARQQIELNRRDARINEVESELERLRATHEETQNARRVLEQTITDRLPRVEHRLGEAKQLLYARDQEIGELTRTADKQASALAEAQAINAQQQSEVERLNAALATRAARNRDSLADPRFDGEVALRAEIEALRTKAREQAQLLQRLQSMVGRPSAGGLIPETATAAKGDEASPAMQDDAMAERAGTEKQLRALKDRNEDQAGELARLKAALAVFESEADSDPKVSLRESRIGLKARMQSLEAQNTQLTETVQRLRSELAGANERAARQAAHFTAELKRLGAGTLPASGQARRPAEPQRLTLAERVAQARVAATGGQRPGKDSSSKGEHVAAISTSEPNSADAASLSDAAPPNGKGIDENPAPPTSFGVISEAAPPADANGHDEPVPLPVKPAEPPARGRRARLLDRIAGAGRP